ncbi:CaiB/BaiF CoA transferase family protein [Achromobacter piechaudii]|uniref:Formyl-CoA:oxalate CoA-transferase n=1 Tax=Achromobacter piechaudii TaxID=72556 RepID=A0ABM8KRH6_9BURK|nr:CoA transferase [Achromobacter piechaudii]KNY11084.1 CoA-transferase [Achromobacter piechaudii]CAB3658815.1 Formyl-CoA:oxalate CoA-transferase [Achromobacter piechaudii]CAB3822764.1 Formyl-CoA:oxalate CoA-transferase [Achromobacter piechaudii]CAB3945342.1 Formyl-CoA:oxalate CoA-transferase [Achromobacter piechaudii]
MNTSINPQSLPLRPYRVLDLTRVRAGPTAVRQLADWGADVIKIEEPVDEGNETEMGGVRLGPDYQNLHRNKRSLTLNLKSPEGVRILKELAKDADVVVENYRPDVKKRLGIDYETLNEINPRLVYASISGFGQDGPYARRPGYDQIIQGMTGMMSVTGIPGHGLVRAGIAIADTTAGMYAAMGILMALLDRERSGKGQWIQTSLLESLLAVMDFQCARWLVAGEVPTQAGNDHPTIIPTGNFPTRDGMICICVSGRVMWTRLCKTLNREDWLTDPRFETNKARSANREQLNAELSEIFSGNTTAHWITLLNDAGLACGAVNSIDQAFEDAQVQHLGVRWPVSHPQLGEIGLVGQPYRTSRHVAQLARVAPMPGEHTMEILREAGLTVEQIHELKESHVI